MFYYKGHVLGNTFVERNFWLLLFLSYFYTSATILLFVCLFVGFLDLSQFVLFQLLEAEAGRVLQVGALPKHIVSQQK